MMTKENTTRKGSHHLERISCYKHLNPTVLFNGVFLAYKNCDDARFESQRNALKNILNEIYKAS